MAHAAILPAKNLAHRNRIGSGLGQEWPGMAVRTIEPKRMGLMRKKNMWHFLGVLHHDIQIEHVHFLGRGKSCARRNCARTQGGHPVRESYGVTLDEAHCLIDTLQPQVIRIRLVVNRVSFQGKARWMRFSGRTLGAGARRILHGRHVWRSLYKCRGTGCCCRFENPTDRRNQKQSAQNRQRPHASTQPGKVLHRIWQQSEMERTYPGSTVGATCQVGDVPLHRNFRSKAPHPETKSWRTRYSQTSRRP